ncbi:MAG: hypothetical protein V3W52_17160 [Syntrophobacteria bacterium]
MNWNKQQIKFARKLLGVFEEYYDVDVGASEICQNMLPEEEAESLAEVIQSVEVKLHMATGDASGGQYKYAREKVLAEVDDERDYQDEKWGVRDLPIDTWFTVLDKQLGQAATCALDRDVEGLRHQLVQVAAVAVAMIEAHDEARQANALIDKYGMPNKEPS